MEVNNTAKRTLAAEKWQEQDFTGMRTYQHSPTSKIQTLHVLEDRKKEPIKTSRRNARKMSTFGVYEVNSIQQNRKEAMPGSGK
ncbi:hypothetical protein NL676_016282 [Syzygium grande]|nr:hypothetical protein NL676_016282 [Syzygium grande]